MYALQPDSGLCPESVCNFQVKDLAHLILKVLQ